uniref:Reverse transcriptase domain-containing protein n=1 Tax=Tanacetum cinerariifolium TaxID=118510 RepID=A0A6L2MNJ3_TANCI|nr:reverse transcriptase domain-containing protein [Tanacetum cinerariifolium]
MELVRNAILELEIHSFMIQIQSLSINQSIFNPPPQPHYNIYLCQLCESNFHYGYKCSQRVSLVYEPKPCYNQSFGDNAYPHDSPGVTPHIDRHCCFKCGDSLDGFFCHQCTYKLIKSSVENLFPSPSESKDISDDECDLPLCDDYPRSNHVTYSNPLFDSNEDFTSSNNESFSEEDVPIENFKTFFNHLFDLDEEIISTKVNPICNEVLESIDSIPPGIDHFNVESDLIESLLNQDSSIISSSKIDSLLDEFAGKLILLKSIPPGIDEADCDPKKEIHLIEKLLYDNSSPRPSEEFIFKNSDAAIESFSPSPILVEDNDSLMEKIGLSLTSGNTMPPGIENDKYDSKGDILILEELLSNDSLSLPENESFYFDIPSSPRPPAKPPDDDEIEPNSRILTVKVCMRTRNSYFLNNSSVTISRRQNKRRTPNVVEPELRTIVAPMADNRTMEELLQAPTEGCGEVIVIPKINADHFEIKTNLLQLVQVNPYYSFERENPHTHINNFKMITSTLKFRDVPNDEMLRVCPHHGFTELAQIDTFYNGLNDNDQDSLNDAVGGNLLSKTTREALQIIEKKSKVRYSRNKPNVSRMNTTFRENASKTDDMIDKLTDQILTLVDIFSKKVVAPASVKAVEESYVTCGGAHAYYNFPNTDSNQPSVCVATGIYNQVAPQNRASNYMASPGFAPVQNSQNSFANALLLMPNFASAIKSLLTNKDKLFELDKISLNENCSAMLLKKRPENLGDPEEYAQEMLGFSNNSTGGNPTLTSEPILFDSSPSLTPFEGSDFILEEIDAYLKEESISPEIDHADCDPEGDICLIENLLNNDPF